MTDFILNFGIPLVYVALAIAVLSAVAFPVLQMVTDFQKAKMAIAGVGVLFVVFLLSYMLAGNQPLTTNYVTISGEQMKLVEAGLYMVYIFFVVSVIAIAFSSVSRYFK